MTAYFELYERERDTILAALRWWQETIRQDPKAIPDDIWAIARAGAGDALTFANIDQVCHELNSPPEVDEVDECPNCGDIGLVTGGAVDVGADMATQLCGCDVCGAEWVLGFGLASVNMVRP